MVPLIYCSIVILYRVQSDTQNHNSTMTQYNNFPKKSTYLTK